MGPRRAVGAVRVLTRAEVGPGGVLGVAESGPPLTLRRTHDEPGRCGLTLVGSAAGPLAGDDVALQLTVAAGARARLRATGASLAQGVGDRVVRTRATVGAGAELDADPGPLIVCRDAHVDVSVRLELAAGAAVRWRELVVLGRSGEPGGTAVLDWDVGRDGRPVLRQRIDLRDPALTGWRGHTDGARVLATDFVTDPALTATTVVESPHAVRVALDPHTTLTTVLADRADVALDLLRTLAPEFGTRPP